MVPGLAGRSVRAAAGAGPSGGGIRAPGRTPIDKVSEILGLELPDSEWDSVGGLVFNLLGHVPEAGETVRFQGLEFRTERVDGRRIAAGSPPEMKPFGQEISRSPSLS